LRGAGVRFVGCGRRFGNETVLERIDLDIAAGEFVALLGPSGCGKSTMLRLVAGLDRPTSGSVLVGDTDAESAARADRRRGRRAFVFQDPALLPWRSVAGNVRLPEELAGRSVDPQRLSELLEQVGLRPSDASKLPRQLSGGMRMRVSLARAWMTDPELLLMDEPFGALDDVLRQELGNRLVASFERSRPTVLFVTHQVAEAVALADRVVVMATRPGRIVDEVRVPFGRPRSRELATDPEFHRVVAELHASLRRATKSERSTDETTTELIRREGVSGGSA